MTPGLPASQDIDAIAERILRDSRCRGVFPTPVDQIIQFTELKLAEGVDLSQAPTGFLEKYNEAFRGVVARTLSKLLGLIDLREKTIYLDLQQQDSRKRFVKLHEVGHHALPWQNEILYVDDEKALGPFATEEFEREASYFASAVLFQGERFTLEADKLPLGITSPMALGKKFGSSRHAAMRRYVEFSGKRCALLVLEQPRRGITTSIKVRDYFQSARFTEDFGNLQWPEECGVEYGFVADRLANRRFHEKGTVKVLPSDGTPLALRYHFFNSTYNSFILLLPEGEKNRSRITIVAK